MVKSYEAFFLSRIKGTDHVSSGHINSAFDFPSSSHVVNPSMVCRGSWLFKSANTPVSKPLQSCPSFFSCF